MRELATAMYLAFNDPQKIETVFRSPLPDNPAYRERPYWGPHAVPDQEEAA